MPFSSSPSFRLRLLSAGLFFSAFCLPLCGVAAADETPPASAEATTKVETPSAQTPGTEPIPTVPSVAPTAAPTVVPTPLPTPISSESLRAALTRLKLPLPLPKARIVVSKAARTLELFNGDTLLKRYRVALGPAPQGHKQNRGDGRTPEGQFYICTRNAKDSAFHIFLGLSYPALPDAARGVNQKIITWRDYQIIRQRLASRGAPLWETRLGGWVGIHGGTGQKYANRISAQRRSPDWTQGCIALTDAEIKELYVATRLGTPVLVKP